MARCFITSNTVRRHSTGIRHRVTGQGFSLTLVLPQFYHVLWFNIAVHIIYITGTNKWSSPRTIPQDTLLVYGGIPEPPALQNVCFQHFLLTHFSRFFLSKHLSKKCPHLSTNHDNHERKRSLNLQVK
jgi:hypothetical protein